MGRRWLRRARRLLGDSPLFLPVVLRATPTGTSRRLTSTTALVVEGFPRSGNTFVRQALLYAQGSPIEISSHVHTPSAVKAAVRRDIPCLVLIRAPEPTLASLLVAAPHVTARAAISEWCHHYEEIWPFRHGFVVATFDQVTSDLGEVTSRLDARFGLDLRPFGGRPEDLVAVFDAIGRRHLEVHGGAAHLDPRPAPSREVELRRRAEELRGAAHRAGLARAAAIYERYRALSAATAGPVEARGAAPDRADEPGRGA